MFFVYILKSISSGHPYVGVTAKLPSKRLEEHNLGSNSWTALHKPFTLLYYESYHCQQDALHREKFLKSGQGRKLVKLIIENYQAVSAKGGPASGGG